MYKCPLVAFRSAEERYFRGEVEEKLNFQFPKGVILVQPTDDRRS